MKSFLPTYFLLFIVMIISSCQKEFILPEKQEEKAIASIAIPEPDSARINFIWVKINSAPIGARLELRNDTGAVLLNALDMLQNNDTIFQFNVDKGINLEQHQFTVKSPSGATLDTLLYNFEYKKNQDEIIIERPNLKYYIQISWLHKSAVEH